MVGSMALLFSEQLGFEVELKTKFYFNHSGVFIVVATVATKLKDHSMG